MSVSLSSIAISCTITNLRPSYPMEMHSTRFLRVPLVAKTSLLRLCSTNSSHTSMTKSSDLETSSVEKEKQGPTGKGGFFQAISLKEMLTKLKRYGVSGILSYGLLNTAYYSVTFLVVWLYVAPAPGRMGYLAAVERFLKVMAMVWAGSQVTKLIRVGGALALAPFVDRGLSWFTIKFGFKSQGKVTILQATRTSYSNDTHNITTKLSTSLKLIGTVNCMGNDHRSMESVNCPLYGKEWNAENDPLLSFIIKRLTSK